MNDYAFFIWGSYGVSAAALVLTTIWALRSYAKTKARLAALGGKIA